MKHLTFQILARVANGPFVMRDILPHVSGTRGEITDEVLELGRIRWIIADESVPRKWRLSDEGRFNLETEKDRRERIERGAALRPVQSHEPHHKEKRS